MVQRNEYWDVVKGVAIIAVLTIHAANYGLSFDAGTVHHQIALSVLQFVDFPVATFLLLSGYFANTKALAHPVSFWTRRITRLLPPYLIWTAVYLAILYPGDLLKPVEIAKHLITGTGIGIGYYIIVLLQMIVLTPLLNAIGSLRWQVAIMVATAAMGLICSYAFQLLPGVGRFSQFPFNMLPFVVWCPFYQLGFVISKFKLDDSLTRLPRGPLFSLYVVAIALSFVEAFWVWGAGSNLAPFQLKLTSVLTSLAIALLVFRYANSEIRSGGLLAKLGQSSFFIYLTHLLVFIAIEPSVRSVPLIADNQFLYLPILVFATLAILWAAIEATASVRSMRFNQAIGLA
jgi:fucose 4-O-acetylase-like acetyltransferase